MPVLAQATKEHPSDPRGFAYLAATRGDFSGLGLYVLRAALPSAILTAGLVTVAFHFVPQSRPRRLSEREKKLLLEQQ